MTAETDLLPLPDWMECLGEVSAADIRDYARANMEAMRAEVEALRAEVERAHSWNERVSVCRDHVADIVDGICVICALDAAEARADNLRAEVERLTFEMSCLRQHYDEHERAEQLAEALREAYRQVRELCDCYGHVYPEASFVRYEALLRDQEEGHE